MNILEKVSVIAYTNELEDKVKKLETDLKEANEKLDNIKYLKRGEVEGILNNLDISLHLGNGMGIAERFPKRIIDCLVTALLTLAIPEVDRDRIVEDEPEENKYEMNLEQIADKYF
jgi:hypothetical protein